MRVLTCLAASLLTACATRPAPVTVEAPLRAAPPPVVAATGSLWNQEPASLFGNRRARAIGDILTVIVEIDDEAELDNEVDRSRQVSETFSLRSLFGAEQALADALPNGAGLDPAIDYERSRDFSGTGSVRREDRITLRLAARVTDLLPNGDMLISGEQIVRVNHDERILRAEGIIRPEDISRANTIAHDKIAEARIGYVGRGAIDRTLRPGWGERVVDIITPF
jgi:flagellar L-ring protein precursor FlgH